MNANKALIAQLSQSKMYRAYEQAFEETTGMPLVLTPTGNYEMAFRGHHRENAFCALMAKTNSACSACLRMQEGLRQNSCEGVLTGQCLHGLCEAAMPIRQGEKVIGYLQTGQILTAPPTTEKTNEVVEVVQGFGLELPSQTIADAYHKSPVVPAEKFQAMVRLLQYFAELLSIRSSQAVMLSQHKEHPAVAHAKKIVEERYTEKLSLEQVSNEVHISPFYLCKLFRRSTGMTFTEFLSRVRVEEVKRRLLDSNQRVSEIVYAVGFQSLTHFNRVFKKLVGESPSQYRKNIQGAVSAMGY